MIIATMTKEKENKANNGIYFLHLLFGWRMVVGLNDELTALMAR